jgi:hypothetical protein
MPAAPGWGCSGRLSIGRPTRGPGLPCRDLQAYSAAPSCGTGLTPRLPGRYHGRAGPSSGAAKRVAGPACLVRPSGSWRACEYGAAAGTRHRLLPPLQRLRQGAAAFRGRRPGRVHHGSSRLHREATIGEHQAAAVPAQHAGPVGPTDSRTRVTATLVGPLVRGTTPVSLRRRRGLTHPGLTARQQIGRGGFRNTERPGRRPAASRPQCEETPV